MTGAALLHHRLERAADQLGDRSAVLAGDERWSFQRLDRASSACARHLLDRGVAPGGRVALMTSNRPEFLVTVCGVSKLGASSVLLSPAWKTAEVAHALELTG